MQPVASSNVSAIGYDAASNTAFVQFNDGAIYAYEGVSQVHFDQLRQAPSIGSDLHRHFKPHFRATRVHADLKKS